jgi:hypothetical protein
MAASGPTVDAVGRGLNPEPQQQGPNGTNALPVFGLERPDAGTAPAPITRSDGRQPDPTVRAIEVLDRCSLGDPDRHLIDTGLSNSGDRPCLAQPELPSRRSAPSPDSAMTPCASCARLIRSLVSGIVLEVVCV